MIRYFLGLLLLSVIGGLAYLLTHLGAFKDVKVDVSERPELKGIVVEHLGPYHEISPKIMALEKWAHENHIPCKKTFAQFLDDPKKVEQDRLHSRGGCLVPKSYTPDLLPDDYMMFFLEAGQSVFAEFSGSPAISPFKVYPKIEEFIDKNRLNTAQFSIEIYLINGDKVTTEYHIPIISGDK